MCIKQFFGYTCGHCSIPTLIRCPLAASNPNFPICSYPAERPVFTGMYCHPCFRIVWNVKVLKDEEEHRDRHLKGECKCEVRFEGENRGAPVDAGRKGTGQRQEFGQHGASHAPAANVDRIAELGQALVQQHFQQQFQHQAPGPQIDYPGYFQQQAPAPQDDYAAYFQQQDVQVTAPNQSYAIAVGANNLQGQLIMGEAGSEMKWYPHPPLPQPGRSRHHKTPRAQKAAEVTPAQNSNLVATEPGPSVQDAEPPVPGPSGEEVEAPQPMVVSSSTVKGESA